MMLLSEVALIAATALRFSRSPVQGGAAAAAAAPADDAAFGGGAHCSHRFAI
jgi:Spy/CpxP family protein refolding chaperone